MNIFKLAEKAAKKMKWYDFKLLKLSVFFATLCMITAWEAFRNLVMQFEWYWYLAITVILTSTT